MAVAVGSPLAINEEMERCGGGREERVAIGLGHWHEGEEGVGGGGLIMWHFYFYKCQWSMCVLGCSVFFRSKHFCITS